MKLTFILLASVMSVFVDQLAAFPVDENEQKLEVSDTCTDEYKAVAKSTYCATDSCQYINGSAKLTDDEKKVILERHNYHRRRVTPKATDMLQMHWDDELAKGAEKWARQCYSGHDKDLGMKRDIPKYGVTVSQNGALGTTTNWTKVIDSWHSGVSFYTYGAKPAAWWRVAHYTQVVGKAYLVGCGYAECENVKYKKRFFCNYIPGQLSGDIQYPYTNGSESCSACPMSCKDKLCDCGAKFCFNGGTLNKDICACECTLLYKGDTCEEKRD